MAMWADGRALAIGCHGEWKSWFYRKHIDFWESHAEGSHVCSHPPICLVLTDQVHVGDCGDLKSATEWILGPYPCDMPSGVYLVGFQVAKPQRHLFMFYFLKIRFHCVAQASLELLTTPPTHTHTSASAFRLLSCGDYKCELSHLVWHFSCCCDKNTQQKQLKGGRVPLAHSSRAQSLRLGKARWQERAAAHIALTVRGERWCSAHFLRIQCNPTAPVG